MKPLAELTNDELADAIVNVQIIDHEDLPWLEEAARRLRTLDEWRDPEGERS